MFLFKKKNFYSIVFSLKILFFIALFSSCIPQDRLRYLQDSENTITDTVKIHHKVAHKIKPYDELYIKILTYDEKMSNFFNSSQSSQNTNNDASLSLISYTIDEQGNIEIPILGEMHVEGLTLKEAKAVIQKELDEYLDQSALIVKLVNNKITILGEVKKPGKYTIYKDQINLLEALGMAGDMTSYGDRKRVTLIREINNKTTFHYLDLTSKEIMKSEYFLLQPNDIVYIEAINAKTWSGAVINYTTILSTISTLITLLYFLKNFN